MKASDKNIYFLVAANCINKIYDIFFGMFLVSFLFRHTKENVSDISIYHLVCFLAVGGLAYLTGNWIKRGNRLLMYQLGIMFTFVFFLFFIYFKENIANHIPLCGLAYGFIISFKAFPNNLIIADNIPNSQMIAFKGYLESLKNVIRVLAPLLLGFFLTLDSYFRTVSFLAVLSVVEFVLFALIKAPIRKELPRLDIKAFWQNTTNLAFVKQLYKIEFCRGMTIDGALNTVIMLYVIYLFKTDLNLGIISSIFYTLTILLNFIFGRYCRYQHFVKILVSAALLVISSIIVFLLVPNQISFIFYNFCLTVVTQFMRMIVDINMYNVCNRPEVLDYKNEYFVVRELFLNMGRLCSYTLLLLFGLYGNFALLKYLLLILTIFIAFMSLNGIRLNRQFGKK